MTAIKSLTILAVLLAIVVAAIWALVTYVGLQASLVWAAVVGGFAWLVRTEIEKKRELVKLLAEQKRKQYLEFLDFILQYIGKEKEQSEVDAGPAKFREWSMRLTLIGSDEVVKAWNEVRALGDGGAGGTELDANAKQRATAQLMRVWGTLLLEMRKDCGHPDTKLTKSDVFATFINDMDAYRFLVDEDPSVPGVAKDRA